MLLWPFYTLMKYGDYEGTTLIKWSGLRLLIANISGVTAITWNYYCLRLLVLQLLSGVAVIPWIC